MEEKTIEIKALGDFKKEREESNQLYGEKATYGLNYASYKHGNKIVAIMSIKTDEGYLMERRFYVFSDDIFPNNLKKEQEQLVHRSKIICDAERTLEETIEGGGLIESIFRTGFGGGADIIYKTEKLEEDYYFNEIQRGLNTVRALIKEGAPSTFKDDERNFLKELMIYLGLLEQDYKAKAIKKYVESHT